jgi:hypothetical protein
MAPRIFFSATKHDKAGMWFVNCEQRFFQIFWVKEMYMG